jgi:hypothetical protein
VAPDRGAGGGATLMGGIGGSAAPMNGYPKVFNIESDPHEEHNIGEMYNWVYGPAVPRRRLASTTSWTYEPSIMSYLD